MTVIYILDGFKVFHPNRGPQRQRVIADQALPDRGMRYCRIPAWTVAPPAMGPRDVTHPLDHVVAVQRPKLLRLRRTSVRAGGGLFANSRRVPNTAPLGLT